MSVRVKICGITRVVDAECAIAAGADIIGLNFYAPSPRAVSIDRAAEIRAAIRVSCQVAGVFVNAPRAFVETCVDELRLDFIQFHGDEPDEALRGWPVKVVRALRLRTADPAAIARACAALCDKADYLLIDTFHPGLYGGTGCARSLIELGGLDLSRVFLSGGLRVENVAAAAALNPYAVDVASGVESAPGIKDETMLRSFIANAKSAG
jgi:phosphoribosylanthranilate isomerase